jgi:ribonuclease Z
MPGLVFPVIYYPRDCRSFPAMEAFSKQFDPHVSGQYGAPIVAGEEIRVKEDIVVAAFRNEHVPVAANSIKSLSYRIMQTRRKLRPELAGLTGEDIKRISQEQGKESTTVEVRTTLLGYSGDTPVRDAERWMDTHTLIHEATFLNRNDVKERTTGNQHSTLEEVMAMVSELNIAQLVLGHFSPRYTAEQIKAAIREQCALHKIQIPAYAVLPGEVVTDILKKEPVNR